MDKINNYLDYLHLTESLEFFEEGVGDIIKKFTVDKVKALLVKLKNLIETDNLKGVQSLIKTTGLAKANISSIDDFMSSKHEEYNDIKNFATKVLRNSMKGKLSKKRLNIASTYVTLRTYMPERRGVVPKPKRDSKQKIKEFVNSYNSYYDEYEEKEKEGKINIPKESIPDYILGITIIVSLVSILGYGIWFITTYFWTIILALVALSLIWAAGKGQI